jgi:hypothetical protein
MTIHGGMTPPDITGTYLHDSVRVVDVADARRHYCNIREELTMYGGRRSVVRNVASIGPGCDGSSRLGGVFISGSDRCFTLYFRSEITAPGCTSSAVRLVSGCVGASGLTGYREASFDEAHVGDSCAALVACGLLAPAGQVSMVEEKDGLVARVP